MFCRIYPLFIAAFAIASLSFSGCKTIYRDTYTWKKNNFVPPPPEAKPEIDISDLPASVTQSMTVPEQSTEPMIEDPSVDATTTTPDDQDSMSDSQMMIPGL